MGNGIGCNPTLYAIQFHWSCITRGVARPRKYVLPNCLFGTTEDSREGVPWHELCSWNAAWKGNQTLAVLVKPNEWLDACTSRWFGGRRWYEEWMRRLIFLGNMTKSVMLWWNYLNETRVFLGYWRTSTNSLIRTVNVTAKDSLLLVMRNAVLRSGSTILPWYYPRLRP